MTQKAGWGRTKALLGLIVLYALFGMAIAFAFRSWWLLGTFATVMAGRIWSVFAGQDEMGRAISQRRVAASAMMFLLLTFATVFVPVPKGGIDPGLLQEVWPRRGHGLWEASPERESHGLGEFFSARSGGAAPAAPMVTDVTCERTLPPEEIAELRKHLSCGSCPIRPDSRKGRPPLNGPSHLTH
jgi:hypothetical protein